MTSTVTQNVCHRPFNPTTKALQFRAWQIAQREGGNVTRAEIAAELGVSPHRLLNAIRAERWAASLRSVTMDCLNANDGAATVLGIAAGECSTLAVDGKVTLTGGSTVNVGADGYAAAGLSATGAPVGAVALADRSRGLAATS